MNDNQYITAAQWFDTFFAHVWAMLGVAYFSQGHWLCGIVCLIASGMMALA